MLGWIFYAFPAITLQIPSVQRKVASKASEELSAQLNVPVKVGKADIEWLNRIVLGDVSLEDQSGNMLLKADHISAGFKIWPIIFQRKWVFTTARLYGTTVNLQKETPESPLNMQFVIDAFASKDTTKKTDIDLQINSVMIRRGCLNYDVLSEPQKNDKLDIKHLKISNINGKIALNSLNKDSLSAYIEKLSFEEKSGFKLSKLSMNLVGNRDSTSIRDLIIQLPQTKVNITNATLWQNGTDSLDVLLNQAPIKVTLGQSQICLKDIAAIVPALKNYSDIIELSASTSGTINNLSIDDLSIKQNSSLSLDAQINLKGISRAENTYLFSKISDLRLTSDGLNQIINNFQDEKIVLPEPIIKLGNFNFHGEISGFIDRLVAFGILESDIGSLDMDMLIGQQNEENVASYLKGKISSSELNINSLFNENNPYGIVRFNAELDASRPVKGHYSGTIQAQINQLEYKKYLYENILLSGSFKQDEFNGTISIDDPNGKLHAEGLFKNNGEFSAFNFSAKMEHLRPDKLFLTNKYENPDISFSIRSNITGNNIDNFQGHIAIDDLAFLTQPDSFYLSTMRINASGESSERRLSFYSDLINGEITGAYSFSNMLTSVMNTSSKYLPSLSEALQDNDQIGENRFSFLISVENTEQLSNTLKLPITILKPSRILGHYNNQTNKFRIDASMPRFMVAKSVFEAGSIVCENPNDDIQLDVNAIQILKKGGHNLFKLNATADDDKLKTLFSIENKDQDGIKFDLAATTHFISSEENGIKDLSAEIAIEPNTFIIKDSTWEMKPAAITITKDLVSIDNISLSKGEQYLRINGKASTKKPKESILLDLKDIELSYIFDMVNIAALQFGGRATGTVRLNDLYGSRIINTDLEVQNFSFNQVVQGRLNLFSEWDNDQNGILLLGTIYKNDYTWTDVNGYIYPVGEKQGLSLYFDATDVDLGMLRPYFKAFTNTFDGSGSGHIHLFGPFSDLTFEGKARIRNGRIGVDFLNTSYTFADSVFLTPTSIQGNNISIKDKAGNKGTVSFAVHHNHLKDFSFQANIEAQNLLIYDAPEKVNPQIYGVLYGTGNGQIKGNERIINIDANLRSNKNTSVGFNFMSGSSAEEYEFIKFKDQQTNKAQSNTYFGQQQLQSASDNGTEIRINVVADVTPDANFELIMDPIAGDKIKGNGSGNFQVQYGTSTNLSMYGSYTIQEGSYNFSLQQVIHKDFKIREGSKIDFQGDPLNANLNLDASYYLKANIEDLDERLAQESGAQRSVPVNCLLKLNGRLQSPTISFDMEFPNSTNELARQVRSFIGTEDMMTRQIIYLLVLNRFYTQEDKDYRSSEFSLVASSALSAQLSSILNSLTDKVQIGTNIRSRQDGITDTEVEMLLSSQLLNNRLLFNGNFGYRDNYIQSNAFVGEFDLEYKLTPSGEIRLKAYSHANDMYYDRYNLKSLTRQGVGIMFHKDFSTLSELFRRRKRLTLESTPSKK